MRNKGLEGKQTSQLQCAIKQSAEAPEKAEKLSLQQELEQPPLPPNEQLSPQSSVSKIPSVGSRSTITTHKMLWDTRNRQSLRICLAGY